MDIDYEGDGLLASETVGKVWVGIAGWFCWDFDEFWRVRWDGDGVGVLDSVDEFTSGA